MRSGEFRGIFAAPPAQAASGHSLLPTRQHRGSEHGMGGRTPFATRLGAPFGQVAPQIMKRSAESLRMNRFPQSSDIVLSGFPALPRIGDIPVDFARALSGRTPRNRIRPLLANDGSPRNAQQTGNFRLRFALPGVVLHLTIPLCSVLRSPLCGGPVGGTPASRPRQSR